MAGKTTESFILLSFSKGDSLSLSLSLSPHFSCSSVIMKKGPVQTAKKGVFRATLWSSFLLSLQLNPSSLLLAM